MPHSTLTRLARRLPQPGASDRELLARFASDSDEGAFAALVGRHGRAVLAACRHVLADPADVDDAFQATFLLLFRRAGRVKWGESAGGWLYAAAHRIAVRARADRHRRTARESAARKPERVDAPDPSWREAVVVLHAELDKLPDRHRLPLLLCYLDGRSRDEAAALLGWSAGAVKGCLERGRRLLADRLRRRGIDLSAGLFGVLAADAAVGGPPDALIEQTLAAAVGGASATVTALVKGTTPMKLLPKAVGLALVAAAALAATAVGLPHRPAAAPPPPAAKPEVAEPADDETAEVESAVAGRVVGPDDQPVAGAAVYWLNEGGSGEGRPKPRVVTAADGRFRFTVKHPARNFHDGKPGHPWLFGGLVVTADGLGIGWRWTREPAADVVVKLPPDDRPVRGKVVDAAGKGIAGVTVRCLGVFRPEGGKDLSDWLAAGRANEHLPYLEMVRSYYLETPLDRLLPATTTGPDGTFELRGVGRERVAWLFVGGPTAAAQLVRVFTREAEGFSVRHVSGRTDDVDQYRVEQYHGLPATVRAAPAVPVEGAVTAADTGKPVPGVLVRTMVYSNGDEGHSLFLLTTRTGPDGRYRLDGLTRAHRTKLDYVPPAVPLHAVHVMAPVAAAGEKPEPVDVALPAGVWVNVKVREKGTGKPVAVAHEYAVFKDNPHYAGGPPFLLNERYEIPTASDFRVVAFPGPGMLAVRSWSGGPYLLGVGGGQFPKYRQGDEIGGTQPSPSYPVRGWNTFVPLAPFGNEPVDLTVEVDPGVTAEVRTLEPDGTPAAGTAVWGLRPGGWRAVPAGRTRFTVRGLERGEGRRVVVAHEEKKLVGTAVAVGGAGPVAATLGPWATVTGRLVAGGAPVAGGLVIFGHEPAQCEDTTLGPLVGLEGGSWVRADDRGRFTIPGLVPGLKYAFTASGPDLLDRGAEVPPFTAPPPGETKDLGDIRVGG
ncbi:MAG: sigma-70 family RNA polymerase sigma factor [Gemmataceae bacterium]|nr:sigma-70 family RNA polymerase sigma factor [Gemmataceae bacterium]